MAPCDWVRAHVESGFGGDAVEDHTEHDGKRHANLFCGITTREASAQGGEHLVPSRGRETSRSVSPLAAS